MFSQPVSAPARSVRHLAISLFALGLWVHAAPLLAAPQSWLNNGQPTAAARQAVAVLGSADLDGLNPQAYDAARLQERVARAGNGSPLAAAEAEQLDADLNRALRLYIHELRFGRLHPASIEENYSPVPTTPDAVDQILSTAQQDNRMAELPQRAAPPIRLYADLRAMLAHYRELARQGGWEQRLPSFAGSKLSPGDAYTGLTSLTRRLIVLGDLPANTAVPSRYQGALVDGVRAFQRRHGLTPDGVIGAATFRELNVAPAERVQQIELAMERLRWLPLNGPRLIVVNIPEFRLRGLEWQDGQPAVALAMNVIVGASPKTPTPLFDAPMRFIEFSPYWNVPPSIARGETIPKLRKDPGYFANQGFEFVDGSGKVVTDFSPEALEAASRGQLRIRQRPGARNALGDIKFVFPNPDNIYLHHTPTPQLFKRDRRDFSHGCIRVEAPVDLARFVLANDPAWTQERIEDSMKRGKSSTMRLDEELPVVLAYLTAVVIDGQAHFFNDLYGQDKRLAEALGSQPATRLSLR